MNQSFKRPEFVQTQSIRHCLYLFGNYEVEMLQGREVSGEVGARVLARMRRGKEVALALLTVSTLVRSVSLFFLLS